MTLESELEHAKPAWRPLLAYVADLHRRSTHPARPPFPHDWEEIGPGYCYAPAFGHWDTVHQALDMLPLEPDHARAQIENLLAFQEADGYLPATGLFHGKVNFFAPNAESIQTHPPVWPVFVDDYTALTKDDSLLRACYDPLVRQIDWFEKNRRADDGIGFYYTDILNRRWETGVDEGVRFDNAPLAAVACVDATAQVYLLYETAARWASRLSQESHLWTSKANQVRAFLQDSLFDEGTGFFHDAWSVGKPDRRPMALEGMWPVVAGAATTAQAARVIRENYLSPERFFTPHPVATVGRSDPSYSPRMWRGPAWNSMTYWAARSCLRYGGSDAAHFLLEAALDYSALWYDRTGTIWEFYDADGKDPRHLLRKPDRPQPGPCPDYLGHNPLLAMARFWHETRPGS